MVIWNFEKDRAIICAAHIISLAIPIPSKKSTMDIYEYTHKSIRNFI